MAFGFWEAILSFLTRQIGLRTDAADPAGSLHAKVRYINDTKIPTTETNLTNAINTRQAPRGPVTARGSFSSSNGLIWETALNITGKGKLIALGAYSSAAQSLYVNVTVDGYLFNFASPAVADYFYPAPPYVYTWTNALNTAANGGRPDMFQIEFKTSLKIEIYYPTANSHTVYWIYVKE